MGDSSDTRVEVPVRLAGVAQGQVSDPLRRRGDQLLARLPWGASVR